MIYIFKCQQCEKQIEKEKKMTEEFKKKDLICECGGKLQRDFAEESKTQGTIIPEHMTAAYQVKPQSDFRYDSSPSKKKHFW